LRKSAQVAFVNDTLYYKNEPGQEKKFGETIFIIVQRVPLKIDLKQIITFDSFSG
jgi:hypothetical protein